MASENGPDVLLAQQAIEVAANAQLALNSSNRQLGQALGALVGSRVTLNGYPREATVFTGTNEETGQSRFVSAPMYSSRAAPAERQPLTLNDCVVMAVEGDCLVASVSDTETAPQPKQVVSYNFSLRNILGIAAVSDDVEIVSDSQQYLQKDR